MVRLRGWSVQGCEQRIPYQQRNLATDERNFYKVEPVLGSCGLNRRAVWIEECKALLLRFAAGGAGHDS
jgi:hypothetical protein